MNPKSKKKSPKQGADPLTLKDYQEYCDKYFPKRCPHPNCPENDRYPFDDLRECTQFQPIWISIPPGGHVHISCPVHPEGHIIYGPRISYKPPRVTWGEDDFYKLGPNLPEPDTNLPDYSKIGKVWM